MRPERVRRTLLSFTGLFAFVIATALPSPSAAAEAAAEPHPFTVHDLLAMQRISDPQVSPDGTRVLFTLRTTDLEANAGRTDLWLVGADGSGLRQITTHKSGDFNGRWAADGRSIYFLSTRSGSSQIFRLALDGGEALQVTDLPVDVSNLEVSPDGKLLGFSLEVFPACGADLACTKKRLDENAARKASGKIYDSLFIRHWDTWSDGRRNHLFVLPVAGPAMAPATPRSTSCPASTPTRLRSRSAVRRSTPSRPTARGSSSRPATSVARRPGRRTSTSSTRRSTARRRRASSRPTRPGTRSRSSRPTASVWST